MHFHPTRTPVQQTKQTHRELHAPLLPLLQLIFVQKVLHTLHLALSWHGATGGEAAGGPALLRLFWLLAVVVVVQEPREA